MRLVLGCLGVALLAIGAGGTLSAQTRAARLTGIITDSSGAVVIAARIVATNPDTGIKRTAQSNNQGVYVLPLLDPGNYGLLVSKEGFRSVSRTGVALHVNDSVQVDFTLEVGILAEVVTVNAGTPVLEATGASQSVVIGNVRIANLPLNGRNAYQLSALAPGVIPGSGFEEAVTINRMNNINVNGGASFNNEVLLDGASNVIAGHNQIALTPSADTVQEFRVQTTQYSAEFGRTGGGVVNVATKSGTNEFHGTAYHYLRNKVLKANNFFNNRASVARAPFVHNQFGATAGGPVVRNRSFVFLGYEGYRVRQAQNFTGSVPTEAQRRGDFSRTFTSDGQPVVIYDPYTTRLINGAWRRDSFPAHLIPASRFDPVAVKATPYYPLPNQPGIGASAAGNFLSNASATDDLNMLTGRVDHAFSQGNRLFVRASRNGRLQGPPNFFGNLATSNSFGPTSGVDWHVTANDTHTFNAQTVLELRAGYALNAEEREPESLGFDLTSLGLPAAFQAQAQARYFPTISTGYSILGPSSFSYWGQGSQTRSLAGSLTHVRGRHTLKAGGEARILNHNSWQAPSASGVFNATALMTRGPDPDLASRSAGDGYASFLLGTLSGAQARKTADTAYWNTYWAVYLQNDIRVLSNLVLNLGLRYGYETPRAERWNRLAWFNPSIANPVANDIAWSGSPIRGGLQFAGVDGPRGWSEPDRNNVEPRFGFAWQAVRNMVLRGGYGISYLSNGTSHNGYGAGQEGFSRATSEVFTPDGRTAIKRLHEAFAGGLLEPTGSSLGPYTLLGSSINANLRNLRVGYSQQWSLNVQRELPGGWLLEAGYAGSRGVKIPTTFAMNQLSAEQMQLGDALLENVSNPFFGHPAVSGALAGRTIQRRQLLRPYPQFENVSFPFREAGSSTFHSFQARVERRSAHGLDLLASYTNSKLISDSTSGKPFVGDDQPGAQNAYNLRAERSVAPQDVSQRLSASALYELPFDRGGRLLGGWQLNAIATLSTGQVISVGTANESFAYNQGARPHSTGRSAASSTPSIDRWFDTSAFVQPARFTFGNLGRTLPDVRTDGIANLDFGILKHFQLVERLKLQFRAEFFNALNSPRFGRPGENHFANNFGVVSAQANAPREIQFGLRLIF
ncbi:MAG: carboxypeptidase regulatory-like domain-containing protein [Acidobacteria bacterium]|nr:carboxypeptidase regulatory-like domain-containing protein [Acidobacteriota bacterium]